MYFCYMLYLICLIFCLLKEYKLEKWQEKIALFRCACKARCFDFSVYLSNKNNMESGLEVMSMLGNV